MTSIEIVERKIKAIKEILEKEDDISLFPYKRFELETRLREQELILKDLEELEKYRKVMCEPILDIMKKLKLLYILKENIRLIDYCIYNDKIVIYLPVYYREQLKEWLDGKNNL